MGFRSLSFDRSAVLGLSFFVLGVLLPTASVLWFMNEAVTAQLGAARQELTAAYRGQLRLIGDRIVERWRSRADALAVAPDEQPAAAFARLVGAGLADAVIVSDAEGAPAYPRRWSSLGDARADRVERGLLTHAQSLERKRDFAAALREYSAAADSSAEPSLSARAAQGAVRSALTSGDTAAATALIEKHFVERDLTEGRDSAGRVIAADELLLLCELLPDVDPRRATAAERLALMLNDYGIAIPPAQRLFLMEALMEALGAPEARFPTLAAERLAQAYLTTASAIDPGAASLQATRLPDVWRLSFADGRGVALFHSAAVAAAFSDLLAAEPGGIAFRFAPPGESPGDEAIAAGVLLPGWQIGFAPQAAAFEAVASSRRLYYVWVGSLVAAAIGATGLLLLAAFRRQVRLAAMKTDLVAAVSHELRTPLASMRLLVDTLLEQGTADERRTREYLGLVARENARLTRLIESFLEFSRLDGQRRHFELAPTDPRAIVEAAAAAVHERFEQAGCELLLAVEPELPLIDADRDALTTVLVNLLDNALKYTKNDRRIALHARREGPKVVFAVEDNGIGIPAREQKRIFRRFYQVDRRLSRETGGVGLGLSIASLIVRAHRGSLRVASRPGEGSTFSVSLAARTAA
ncbi:MAG TPA: ATP-binding protein [Gammaproteobacteria bacterium]|nr:ATP-binding protein [Gammaproteobacteria bacterium]